LGLRLEYELKPIEHNKVFKIVILVIFYIGNLRLLKRATGVDDHGFQA
jgi:hypothetical protein